MGDNWHMMTDRIWETWIDSWNLIVEIAAERDWDYNELQIRPPITPAELTSIEEELNIHLPDDYRTIVTEYASEVIFSYVIDGEDPPGQFSEISYGGSRPIWSTASLSKLHLGYRHNDDIMPKLDIEFPFGYFDKYYCCFSVENGSVNLVENSHYAYSVNSLSGKTIARSFTEFITSWTEVGCPGSGWHIFYNEDSSRLKMDQSVHKEWSDFLFGQQLSG